MILRYGGEWGITHHIKLTFLFTTFVIATVVASRDFLFEIFVHLVALFTGVPWRRFKFLEGQTSARCAIFFVAGVRT
jgi:hypothetical protein